MKPCRCYRNQNGAALVVALLIAALVAVIGVRMGNEYQLTLRRASNVIYSDQIMLYLYSAESIAKQLLLADEEPEKDYRGEAWAEEYPPVPIGQGMLAAQPMRDLQGRFNLNSLLDGLGVPQGGGIQPESANKQMFMRLLQTFPDTVSDVSQARAIADALIDWLDDGSEPTGFDGAEDSYYAQLDVPYRTADSMMSSVSELRLVKGVTPELYRQLAPHVTVLDVIDNKINMNTATKNVLQAVAHNGDPLQPLAASDIEAYLEQVDPAVGLDSLGLNEYEPWRSLDGDDVKDHFAYTSEYFVISGIAQLGEISLPMRSVLKVSRSENKVTVLSRSTGSL